MRTIALIFGTLLLFSGVVFAQNNNNIKTKFYNFDDILIDGKVTKPKVLFLDSRQKVKFGKLLKLKKSFIPKLKETVKDPTLR